MVIIGAILNYMTFLFNDFRLKGTMLKNIIYKATTIKKLSTLIIGFTALSSGYVTFIFSSVNPKTQLVLMLVLIVFWSISANSIRTLLQVPFEKYWARDIYDAEEVIDNIATALSPVLYRENVYKIIRKHLQNMLNISTLPYFISSQTNPDTFDQIESNANKLSLNKFHPFLYYLQQHKGILEFKHIDINIKKTITEFKIHASSIVIPLYSNLDLDGFFICGQKSSGTDYTSKDLRLFNTIQNQALLVLDRIRPYERIKKDFESNQMKLYETEKLLARSEKIASMANLIQEYNHEIRTPLGVIMGKIEDLLEENVQDESITSKCNTMMTHADRIRDIVDTTLRLSQPKQRHEEAVSIKKIIEQSLELLPPDGIHLATSFDSKFMTSCDIDDMQTVFLNLIKNAKEAMPEGGTLSIQTSDEKSNNVSFVIIQMTDDGIGIATDQIERIWEPFVSRHVTKGRGLGLSIVFRIIREHLGSISVQSNQGEGTCFTIKLPALAKAAV